jgi:poly-beta-1,6-N-acetyl-D-glucosamine synthase
MFQPLLARIGRLLDEARVSYMVIGAQAVLVYGEPRLTEDIDITWKLQKRFYDVRYEPAAVVDMRVPLTLRSLWRQRRRWALGLCQVLRRHAPDLMEWKHRPMWPVLVEASLSILWAHTFVLLTAFWALSYATGHPPVGGSPIPNWWGMLIAPLSLVQLGTGILLDHRYDREVLRHFPVAVFYPLVYWILMSIITVVSTPKGWFTTTARGPTRWSMPRQAPVQDSVSVRERATAGV